MLFACSYWSAFPSALADPYFQYGTQAASSNGSKTTKIIQKNAIFCSKMLEKLNFLRVEQNIVLAYTSLTSSITCRQEHYILLYAPKIKIFCLKDISIEILNANNN